MTLAPVRRAVFVLTFATAALVPSVAFAQITGQHLDELPTPYVDRPLTLPQMHGAAGLDVTFNHLDLGPFLDALNGSLIELNANFGVLDDLELEAAIFSLATEEVAMWPMGLEPIDGADWGMSRFGATVRFVAEEAVEVGARFRLLVDNNAHVGLNFGIPVRVHVPGVFRMDTGFAFTGNIAGRAPEASTFGIFDVNVNPSAPEPGIPFRFAFQPIDTLWLGFNTGFGVLDVENEDSIFFPLGFSLGGTIPIKRAIKLDLAGSFLFPLFIAPAGDDLESTIISELWQVGLDARVHFDLEG